LPKKRLFHIPIHFKCIHFGNYTLQPAGRRRAPREKIM
jgi:hypothetical protein